MTRCVELNTIYAALGAILMVRALLLAGYAVTNRYHKTPIFLLPFWGNPLPLGNALVTKVVWATRFGLSMQALGSLVIGCAITIWSGRGFVPLVAQWNDQQFLYVGLSGLLPLIFGVVHDVYMGKGVLAKPIPPPIALLILVPVTALLLLLGLLNERLCA